MAAGEHAGDHGVAGGVAVEAGVEQALIAGEAVADVGDHGELDGVVEVPIGSGEAADALGSVGAGVAGDPAGLAGWTRGEAGAHAAGEALDEELGGEGAGLVT